MCCFPSSLRWFTLLFLLIGDACLFKFASPLCSLASICRFVIWEFVTKFVHIKLLDNFDAHPVHLLCLALERKPSQPDQIIYNIRDFLLDERFNSVSLALLLGSTTFWVFLGRLCFMSRGRIVWQIVSTSRSQVGQVCPHLRRLLLPHESFP